MIADALFSPALQKILALLFVRVDEAFFVNEIIRVTGLGSASVQRELNRLEKAGLLVSKRLGNLRRFQANRNSPVYPELHSMIQKTFGLAGVLRHALEPLMPDLQIAFVYGSVAKGSETMESDIDLLLIGENLLYGTLVAVLSPAEALLGRRISPTQYSVADFLKRHQEQQHFLMRVLEQPKIFLIGDDDGLRRLGEPRPNPQAQGRTIESA